MAMYKSAEAFIDILNNHGVEKLFINPGFEFIDILSTVAKTRVDGQVSPQLVLCLDEAVTASAAYGNYMVSGKPQVICVHSELGTLQLGANLQNLQWGHIPVVILAAYQEIDVKRTTWDGHPFDQGSIVRNSVKYDRCLNGDEDLHEVLAEAFTVACTEPMGPVYLCFPMRYLYGEIEKPAPASASEPVGHTFAAPQNSVITEKAASPSLSPSLPLSISMLPEPDMKTLEQMSDILLAAKNPLLISGNAGRYTQNVASLVGLSQTLGAPVLTGYSWMNFPTDHPLCIGIEQIGGSRKVDECLDAADVILAIDYAMPYVASAKPPKSDTVILHIDVDPLTQGRLLWGRGADIFMKADSRNAIPALEGLIKSKLTNETRKTINARTYEIAERNDTLRKTWFDSAKAQSSLDGITADYLCWCLNQLIDEDSIIVNHTLTHCASVTEQIVRTKPGTWFSCPSGAIGWAPGAALGAASAAPGRIVAAIMSDGGFVWGCPTSALWSSANYRFPFLAIICNNNGYGAIRDPQHSMLGDMVISEQFAAESALDFSPDYALTAQGAYAFGRKIKKPDEVLPALKEALDAVRSGKPAVLDVHIL